MKAKSLHGNGVLLRVRDGSACRTILDIAQLHLQPGAQVGISGVSGSGKTSLLRILSGIALPTEGSVHWGQTELTRLSEPARDAWRGTTAGFIFQDFRLFPTLGALDNVLVPATFRSVRVPASLQLRARILLQELGIRQLQQRVHTMSRGEQQRVAVSRALLLQPALLLADEPTASLDADSGRAVMDALLAYAQAEKATLCVVSHDTSVLDRLPVRLHLECGQLLPRERT